MAQLSAGFQEGLGGNYKLEGTIPKIVLAADSSFKFGAGWGGAQNYPHVGSFSRRTHGTH